MIKEDRQFLLGFHVGKIENDLVPPSMIRYNSPTIGDPFKGPFGFAFRGQKIGGNNERILLLSPN
jgi:hypothetical protein